LNIRNVETGSSEIFANLFAPLACVEYTTTSEDCFYLIDVSTFRWEEKTYFFFIIFMDIFFMTGAGAAAFIIFIILAILRFVVFGFST